MRYPVTKIISVMKIVGGISMIKYLILLFNCKNMLAKIPVPAPNSTTFFIYILRFLFI